MSAAQRTAIAAWYNRMNDRIDAGDYRCIPVPGATADDVINQDQNGNLGYWLCEVLYAAIGRSAEPEAITAVWSDITGIVETA